MQRISSQAIALLTGLAAVTLVAPTTVQLLLGLPLCLAALILWAIRPFDGLTRH
ncbi:MAG TPA: hypothetical protein VGN13_04970 [Solirubrobacteraceae bacterium]|jgi:hypothetical protein